jgi:alpha-2-macroglobulin
MTVRVRILTVAVDEFELPGAEVADMYRPGVFGRQNTGRFTVQAAE